MAFDCVLMDDPVFAADGHTYNRTDIERWLKQHDTSPLTNEPLESKTPQQLQAECDRVDAAADAAIAAFTGRVRQEAAELKTELQQARVGDVQRIV